MRTRRRPMVVPAVCGLAFLLGAIGSASAGDAKPAYPAMAPVEQYRMSYETTLRGKNGFVCLVERSWAAGFDDAEFWNPKLRAPICFNPAAARTVLPAYLERTEWAIAGVSRADMINRTSAELAANRIATPEPGAVAFMMSKQGYLGDLAGHWHPHLMFFFAHTEVVDWGADLHGSPVFAARGDSEPITTFFVLVPTWSDGTTAALEMH